MLVCSFASLLPAVLSGTRGLSGGFLDGALDSAAGQFHKMIQADSIANVSKASTRNGAVPATWTDLRMFQDDTERVGSKVKQDRPERFPCNAKHSKIASALAKEAHEFIQESVNFYTSVQSKSVEHAPKAVAVRTLHGILFH